jgi:hypothetical protein
MGRRSTQNLLPQLWQCCAKASLDESSAERVDCADGERLGMCVYPDCEHFPCLLRLPTMGSASGQPCVRCDKLLSGHARRLGERGGTLKVTVTTPGGRTG